MSKKDKKIEIQIQDQPVTVNGQQYEGVVLSIGKKVIGEIAELSEHQYAVVKHQTSEVVYKKMEKAVAYIIENYNLNH